MEEETCKNPYNMFEAMDSATKVIIDYLVNNNENLWKLLYYTDPKVLPLSKKNLTKAQKSAMISKDPYTTNENVDKNILFQTVIDEAFSTAIPQLRIEIGDVIPYDAYQAYMEINFQIIVPVKMDVFSAPYNIVARRTDAIFRELAKTFQNVIIPNSSFLSPMFMDRGAKNGTGKKNGTYRQQMNTSYCGRWVNFTVLI